MYGFTFQSLQETFQRKQINASESVPNSTDSETDNFGALTRIMAFSGFLVVHDNKKKAFESVHFIPLLSKVTKEYLLCKRII